MINTANRIVLRNERFGGIYFDQLNGRTVMVDHSGFNTLLKKIGKRPLNDKEKRFIDYFFNANTPKKVKIRPNKSIRFESANFIVTATPILIDLSLNNYCNLQCPYCYMSAKPIGSGEELTMKDFKLLLEDMKKSRVLQIALGGGEPTLHPHFTDFLRKLRIEGDIIPNYTTNGTNLTPEILKASKEYCGAVAVSYSEKREMETLKAAKLLIENGIQTNVHIVLLKSRIRNLSNIIEKYAKLGIHSVVLLLFKPMGRGKNLKHEILTYKEKKPFSIEILKTLSLERKYGIRLAVDACSAFTVKDFPFLPQSIDGCTSAIYTAYIDWDLKMKPCSFMQNYYGIDLKKYSIEKAWNSDYFERFRQKLLNPRYEGCKACDFFSSCWGGCPLKPELTYCIDKGKRL